MAIYIALIHKDADSDYGVSFPDLPGCVTVGSTLEEARANAVEALNLHIEGMIEDKTDIPAPSDLDAIAVLPDYKTAMATTAIEVAMRAPKTVRVNITLPEDALAEIDAFAETSGTTRSGLIATATRRVIRGKAIVSKLSNPTRFIIGEVYQHNETKQLVRVDGPLYDNGREAAVMFFPLRGEPTPSRIKRAELIPEYSLLHSGG